MNSKNSKRFKLAVVFSCVVSLLCSVLHFIKQDGLQNNTYDKIDVFLIVSVALMAVSLVLFVIDNKNDSIFKQINNKEVLFSQFKMSSRIAVIAMFTFLALFLVSAFINHQNNVEISVLSRSAAFFAFAIDLFIISNLIFYFKHASLIKAKGEKTILSLLTQISFFLTSQFMWMFLLKDHSFDSIQSALLPVPFAGLAGIIICLAMLRSRMLSNDSRFYSFLKNPKGISWIGSNSLAHALYLFLICLTIVFAFASVFI